MKVTIYLNGSEEVSQNTREVRSAQSHILLCLLDLNDGGGLLLYDRKSRMQHRLSLSDIIELHRQAQADKVSARH